jgi:hypothetical protein
MKPLPRHSSHKSQVTHVWKDLCFAELAMMLNLSYLEYRWIFVPGACHYGPMHLSLSVFHQVEVIAQSWLPCGSKACLANITVADLSLVSTNHTFQEKYEARTGKVLRHKLLKHYLYFLKYSIFDQNHTSFYENRV